MNTRGLILGLVLSGCAAHSVDVETPPFECHDGVLTVEGPAERILVTLDRPPPTMHLTDPTTRMGNSEDGCRRLDGCLVFIPLAADAYRIESWDAETEERLCPLDVVVERAP